MHHNNHKNSTANHSNHQHQKPNHMHFQYGKNDMPNPQRPAKSSVLSRISGRFKEKPATTEEVRQLRLNASREIAKTQIQKAKSARPSRFSFGGGFQSAPPSYRRGSRRAAPQTGSWLLGESSGMGDSFFSGGGQGPSLDFITGGSSKQQGRRSSKPQRSGLDDLFT